MRSAILGIVSLSCIGLISCGTSEPPTGSAQNTAAAGPVHDSGIVNSEATASAATHDGHAHDHAHDAQASHDAHVHDGAAQATRGSHDHHAAHAGDDAHAAHAPARHAAAAGGHGSEHAHAPKEGQAPATGIAAADADPTKVAEDLADLSAEEVFERRILPIAQSDRASSCRECHFGGVELQNYIGQNQAATFAALRDEGLIDVEQPDQSKILQFINRRPEQADPLRDKVRQAE
jgi:hypothetical protein